MTDLITVIVPIYNVEKYLRRCIESICAQTYKNIEIILVDDGSPDNCGQICDEYAAKDSRIIVIHKENGGISSARNAGIDISTGIYICFVDSDDYVNEKYAEKLYRALKKYNSDLSVCNYYRKSNNKLIEEKKITEKNMLSTDKYFYSELCLTNQGCYVWNKLFRADIIKENKIRYAIKGAAGTLGEDMLFVSTYALFSEKVSFISDPLYIYVDSDTSICNKVKSKSIYDYELMVYDALEKLYLRSDNKRHKELCRFKIVMKCMSIIYDNKKYKLQKDTNKYKRRIRKNLLFFLFYNAPLRLKIHYVLMAVSPSIFDSVRSFYRKTK